MTKTVYIIHGWDNHPENGWFPWLKKELENRGFNVVVPQMPNPKEPRINTWIPKLQEICPNPDENTYFIGHSMGCQTIARYLEKLPDNVKMGGVIFVAGFFKRLTGLEKDEIVQEIANEWLKTPIKLEKVKNHTRKNIAIFSDNDPYVPLDNQDEYRDQLGAEIIIEHNMGHFSGSTGTTELPSVLNAIIKITK